MPKLLLRKASFISLLFLLMPCQAQKKEHAFIPPETVREMLEKAKANQQQIAIKVHINSAEKCLSDGDKSCGTDMLRGKVLSIDAEYFRLEDPYGTSGNGWSYKQIISIKPRNNFEKGIKKVKQVAKGAALIPVWILIALTGGIQPQ